MLPLYESVWVVFEEVKNSLFSVLFYCKLKKKKNFFDCCSDKTSNLKIFIVFWHVVYTIHWLINDKQPLMDGVNNLFQP